MGNLFSGWHLIIILVIILLLFGAPKLPALAKSLGQSMRIFRGEMSEMKKDRTDDAPAEGGTAAAANTAHTAGEPQAGAGGDVPPASDPRA